MQSDNARLPISIVTAKRKLNETNPLNPQVAQSRAELRRSVVALIAEHGVGVMLESLNDRQAGQITGLLGDLYTARVDSDKHKANASRWRGIAFAAIIYGLASIVSAVLWKWGK